MSQRGKHSNKTVLIKLEVQVSLDYVSMHNGITEEQLKNAEEEFEDTISMELYNKLEGLYQMEEFLDSADFIDYTVTKNR